jgi:hypothetical protein
VSEDVPWFDELITVAESVAVEISVPDANINIGEDITVTEDITTYIFSNVLELDTTAQNYSGVRIS